MKFDFSEISGDLNNSVILKCNNTGMPAPPVKWFKSNNLPIVNNTENGKFQIVGANSDLKINWLQFSDVGVYRCSAFNQFSHNYMKKRYGSFKLSVNSPPIIISKSAKIQAKPATNAILDCQATGTPKPEITWYKNNRLISKEENRKYKFSLANGSLTILDLNDDDSGIYFCFASSLDRYPIASLNYSFIVPKSFINYTETLLADEFETVILGCKIPSDSSLLETYWVYNKSLRIDKASLKFDLSEDKVTLNIKQITAADSGDYQCFTKTTKLHNYLTEYLIIVNPKPINVQLNTQNVRSVQNKSVILDCTWWFTDSTMLFNKNIDKNLIEWKLNESIIIGENTDLPFKKYEFLDNSNTLLLINNLTLEETNDLYTCSFRIDHHLIKKSIFNLFVGS